MRKTVFILILVFFSFRLLAGPARPGTLKLRQPDGTVIEAVQRGDEFFHVLTDLEGHALIKNNDGYFCYARYEADGTEVSTGYHYGEEAPSKIVSESSSIPYSVLLSKAEEMRNALREEAETPVTPIMKAQSESTSEGIHKKCLVLLVNFSDTTMKYTREQFDDVFNKKGNTAYGAHGCVSEYFNDQFGDDSSFEFAVSPIATVSHTQGYYGGNSNRREYQALTEACRLVDDEIDFSQFDGDGDGLVDNIMMVVAGTDEAESGNTDAIWAFQSFLSYYQKQLLILDGVRINCFTVCAELSKRNSGFFRISAIGTICHEYGHSLGLMDMYDVDGSGSGGTSEALNYYTGVMDCGCYNNQCATPAHYNAIDYDTLGYGDCEELKEGSYVLAPISQAIKYYKVPTDVDGEYYLIECRDHTGWDKYIVGQGLAIYHIDRSKQKAGDVIAQNRWVYDSVNNCPDHQCADMIEPDTKAPIAARAFFPWNNVDSYTPITTPAFVSWDGTPSPLSLTDIEILSDGSVSFTAQSTSKLISPEISDLKVYPLQRSAIISFGCSIENENETGVISWGVAGGEQTEVSVEAGEDGNFILQLENLEPGTYYSASCKVIIGSAIETEASDCSFSTYPLDEHGEPYIFLGSVDFADDGSISSTTDVPLVIFNADNATDIRWYYDDKTIYPGKTGMHKFSKSGILKAVLRYSDGDTETIKKNITVK